MSQEQQLLEVDFPDYGSVTGGDKGLKQLFSEQITLANTINMMTSYELLSPKVNGPNLLYITTVTTRAVL